MRRRLVLALACLPGSVAIACSTYGSSSTDVPIADAAADTIATPPPASGDASTDVDAGEDASNLLPNGDFETGCGGWALDQNGGTLAIDPTARSGSHSCRVCRGSLTGAFSFLANVDMPVGPGTYVFEAWSRATPDDAGAPAPPNLLTQVYLRSAGSPVVASAITQGPPLADAWSQTSALVAYDGDGGATRLTVVLGVANGSGNCWLVDDARLYVK